MAKLTKAQKAGINSIVVYREILGQVRCERDILEARAEAGEHCHHVAEYFNYRAGYLFTFAEEGVIQAGAR